ncbi:hypothetical protein FB451DRAFT_1259990, partial [Mycena latifolia]
GIVCTGYMARRRGGQRGMVWWSSQNRELTKTARAFVRHGTTRGRWKGERAPAASAQSAAEEDGDGVGRGMVAREMQTTAQRGARRPPAQRRRGRRGVVWCGLVVGSRREIRARWPKRRRHRSAEHAPTPTPLRRRKKNATIPSARAGGGHPYATETKACLFATLFVKRHRAHRRKSPWQTKSDYTTPPKFEVARSASRN